MYVVGSLFSGAGLGDLAVDLAGLEHGWFCEIDPFARRILALRWPGVPVLEDVRHVRAGTVRPVDVLIGGFPCQDVSSAGLGRGIVEGTRSGLWFEYLRIIRELRPRFAVLENVKALLGRGMDTVLGGLAESGYDAEWDVLPAAAFGAPHLRERVVIIAYPGGHGFPARGAVFEAVRHLGGRKLPHDSPYWNGVRLEGPRSQAAIQAHCGAVVRRMDDGCAGGLDRLRCLGNGIVPDILLPVLRVIGQA